MGILFISHSSRNNDRATLVRDWLREQGWRDTFLDLDPEHGLAPGQRWQDELKKAGERCSAVIVLISPEWAASRWCVTEFLLAAQLGKRVFPVLIAPTPFADLPVELTAHFQMADISLPGIEADGLNRLRLGLRRAGLDPTDFPWPPPGEPNRPPYRGLRTLEAADAAIFFGRDAQITKGLDALRRMRDGVPEWMLVILGASGSGKSSFLRAGLLARLQRDEENFLVLPVLRPGRAAMTGPTGLANALGLAPPPTAEAIAKRCAELRVPVVDRLRRYADAGKQAYLARPPTLILPVDQGEELFAADQAEGAMVAKALTAAVAADQNLLIVVTIRSDSFAALQADTALATVPRLPFDLPALPISAFGEVIAGPGRLAQLRIEAALTAQLVADLDRADALPLLAFTLERLATGYGADGVLELADYQTGLGGVDGAIGRAFEEAFEVARRDPRLPDDRAALERLARAAFIPRLLRLERVEAEPKRRVAALNRIPPDARPLVDHFVEQRLLVKDTGSDGQPTVEVAHEAVLRHWRLLGRWIDEEREALARAESVIRAAADWRREATGGHGPDGLLLHRGTRLAETEKTLRRDDLAEEIGTDGQAYLAACRVAENEWQEAERRRAIRQRRLQRVVGVLSLVALIVAAVGAWFVVSGQRSLAKNTSLLLTSVAEAQSQQGQFERAMRIALAAAQGSLLRPVLSDVTAAVGEVAYHSMLDAALYGHSETVATAAFSPDGRSIVTASWDQTARVWREGPDGRWTGTPLEGHSRDVNSAAFSPDGRSIVTASYDQTARVWREGPDGRWTGAPLEGHSHEVNTAAFSMDGRSIVTASDDQTARVWREGPDGRWTGTPLEGHSGTVNTAAFSPDGRSVVTASSDQTARVWREGPDGRWTGTPLEGHSGIVNTAAFSMDGRSIVTASWDQTARVWHVEWLLSDYGRDWVSKHGGGKPLEPIVRAACRDSLKGTERIIPGGQDRKVARASVRRLTHEDIVAAPILTGREGEDVCDPHLSALDQVVSWLFPSLWSKLSGSTPPPW